MARKPYDTFGGTVTHESLFTRMKDSLERLQDDCCLKSHLHNTEDNPQDKLLAKGWLAIAEMMKLVDYQITAMATGKIQKDALEQIARKLIH